MKLFWFDSNCSSKCIIINNIGKISLIFEDYIEFLTEDMIAFYIQFDKIIKKSKEKKMIFLKMKKYHS